jgi:hypothetical protein
MTVEGVDGLLVDPSTTMRGPVATAAGSPGTPSNRTRGASGVDRSRRTGSA